MLPFVVVAFFVSLLAPATSTINSPWCKVTTEFQLFSEYTGLNDPEDLILGSTDDVPIDGTLPFKVLIHGYGNSSSFWYEDAVSSYLDSHDVNVITVRWYSTLCTSYDVVTVVLDSVAQSVQSLVVELRENLQIILDGVHLVGFSLGAHIAGVAGLNIEASEGSKIGRITGLDPTGIPFYLTDLSRRLNKNDANFVDVVHTDGGGMGFLWGLGHVDYYPNGGQALQKGCSIFKIGCSHDRAPIYFVESISSNGFIGRQCVSNTFFILGWCRNNDVAVMGENAPLNATGSFYLRTNKKYPYSKGDSGARTMEYEEAMAEYEDETERL